MSLTKIITSLVAAAFSGSQLDDMVVVDDAGARWVRDWQAQPGQSIVPISTASDVTTIPLFRGLRFDGAGVVKFDIAGGATGQTRTVAAGEQWPTASACFSKIYSTANGTTATGIDGFL